MRKSTLTSIRTRVREYENDSAQVAQEAELRFVSPKEMINGVPENEHQLEARKREWIDSRALRLRCNFLEDSLKLYQAELQYHIGEEKRDRRDFERDIVSEMQVLDETNRAVMRQMRQSQVEVESMKEVQEELHKRATTHYERLMARHKERAENQRRVLENENTALRLRVSQLETALQNWKQMEETEATTEANDAHHRLAMLKEEVKEKNMELKRAVQHQHKLEQSLVQTREQLQMVLEFLDGCGTSAQRIDLTIRQTSREHNRLVNRLLNTAQQVPDDPDDDKSPMRRDGDDDDSLDGSDAASGALAIKHATTTADRATNDVIRLQRAVDRVCNVVHEQHVELALAIDSAATVWEGERHQLDLKHREALSHGQTLQARVQVVERQSAAAQEDAYMERDRALQLRDQAIVFLRAKDVKEHRAPLRHVECQTTVTGSILAGGGDGSGE